MPQRNSTSSRKTPPTRRKSARAARCFNTPLARKAIALRRKQLENDASIKKRTREYWNEILDSLCRCWPELEELEMRKITVEQCEDWAGKHCKTMSPTRFNNTVSNIKALFKIAIKKGARRTNPAAEMKRAKIKTKDLSASLPSMTSFAALVAEIRRPKARFSAACADLVEFFAYTGTAIAKPRGSSGRTVISPKA